MESGTPQTPLISAEDLASRLFEEGKHDLKGDIPTSLKVIDVSAGGDPAYELFRSKAIPNALFLNVFKELKEKEGKYPNTFPSEAIVKEVLQGLGINKTDELILYTHPGKHVGATRSYVVLTSYGLNVRILDGGLKRYEELGYPIQEGTDYSGEKSTIDSLENSGDTLASLEELHEFEEGTDETVQVIDMRPTKSFSGDATDNVEGWRQGCIKGSVNILPSEFLSENGTFRSEQEIAELAEKYKLDPLKTTVIMWRTGMAATVGIVGLKKANSLGFPKIKLFDGGWSEYGSNY